MAGQSDNTIDPAGFGDLPTRLGHRPRVLILVAPYYAEIAATLETNARKALAVANCEIVRIAVPGALEIPQALELVLSEPTYGPIDGVVAIGCIIRGETSHYDVVVNNANHWLMDVAISHGVPVGNAILTVDTREQAEARADAATGDGGKGGDAARAVLSLIAVAHPPQMAREHSR